MKKVISILIGLFVIGSVCYVYLTANFLPTSTEDPIREKIDTEILPSTPTTSDMSIDSTAEGRDGEVVPP